MRKKWWILSGVLAALLLSLCFYPVRLRLAPRWMVSRALGTALEQLEERFEDSPVHMLSAALDPEGCHRASVQLEAEQELLGIVRYDLQLFTQLSPCRIQVDGTVCTGGKLIDLSCYLDGDFAAISSRSLLEGSYYGITYDSFSRDIRSRQLLAALIGEKTISQWEKSVSDLDMALSRDQKLPGLRTEDIISAIYGVLSLKPEVKRVSTPAGAARYAHAVTFRASVREIVQTVEVYREDISPELMNWLNDLNQDPDAALRVEFLLHKGNLVQIHVEMDSAQGDSRGTFVLGVEPETEQLSFEIISMAGEHNSRTLLEMETASDEETYREKLRLTQIHNGIRSVHSLDYVFDLSTGELDLAILRDGEEAKLRMNLAGEAQRITIISQNMTPFLNLFLKKPLESPTICTMTLSPGMEVPVPEYRNLDQWSGEDLLTLLAGFGGLLGLKLP